MRRTHSNARPGLVLTPHAIQPIVKGGTGGINLADAIANFDLIPKSLLGQPNGILAKVNGKIPVSKITSTMSPTITGKRQLFLGEVGTYTISNFDSNTEYTVTTNDGSITRNNETITFAPISQIGNYSFVVNDKTYLVDVIGGVITKPSVLTPTNNATGQAQLLTATASSFSYSGLNDTHVSSDWQISPSPDFGTITTAVSDSTTHKTSLTLSTPLVKNTSYYIRVRFKGANYGLSPWSDAVKFTTSSPGDVNTPSITSPSNNATNIAVSFNAIANTFSISGTDTHEATDWQLATDSSFTNVFKSSLDDTVNKTSYTFTGLSNSVTYYLRVRYKGTLAGWSAYSPTIVFTTIPPASINTPSISSPSNGTTGQPTSPSFTSSTFSVSNGSDTHEGSDWQVATDASFTNVVKSVTNSSSDKTSWSVTGLGYNSTYYVRVRHKGVNLGYGSWSTPSSFTTVLTPSVNTPSITSPTNNATNIAISFNATANAFSVSSIDTHEATDWQLATDSSFTNVVKTSLNDTSNKTSYTFTGLSNSTTYYLRVRYKGTVAGWSAYSSVIAFTTAAAASINTPSVTSPTNGATGQSTSPSFSSTSFSVNNGSDTHEGSDWQLATDSNFTNIVRAVTNSSSDKTSWSVSGLSNNTTYYVRVRHKGVNLGYGSWSSASSFTAVAAPVIVTPSITSPTNGATNIAVSFNAVANAFSVSGTDTHEATDWQLATDYNFYNVVKSSLNDTSNKTSYTFSGLSNSTTYYLRVRYKGTLAGWSAYSSVITFTTAAAGSINTPSVSSPTNGATGQSTSPSFSSTSFSVSNGSDTHEGSDWQLATDSNFSNVVKSVTNSSSDRTSWYTSGLSNNTTYYVRVRHKGVNLGYGSWSSASSFTTVAAPSITTPSITSPTNGTTGVGSSLSITSSSFSVANGTDTHLGTDWQIATNSTFTNLVVNVTDDRTNKLSYSATNLVAATTYYLRVRHKGNSLGYSAWSNTIMVTTKSSFVPNLETAKLQASDRTTNDLFGNSVAISSDGNTAIIGAYGKGSNIGEAYAGAVYIFTRSGTSWSQQQKLQASDKEINDCFGISVAISSDSNTAIIGAYGKNTNTGVAYIFIRSGTAWTQQAKLQTNDIRTASDRFGGSVAISSDGNTAIIGAYGKDGSVGAAYVFTRSGATWTERKKLQPSNRTTGDQFGYSVAISSNGNTAIIGAYGKDGSVGAAYIFTGSGTSWTEQAKLQANDRAANDQFGYNVAISSDGNTAIIGAYGKDGNVGAAYIFTGSGTSWSQQQKLQANDKATNDWFGWSVAISSDGNTAIIGAFGKVSNTGAAYIFTRSGTSWSQQAKLQASDKATGDRFGTSVVISSDGKTVIVGASIKNSSTGVAYIYS